MENILELQYQQTGQSTKVNPFGMREMQERAYECRTSQYLLLKAPPASGKSRALMFIALDKLINQGIKKVIIAVPERSIGASFRDTELKKFGFYADWSVDSEYDLCGGGSDNSEGKIKRFLKFLDSSSKVLVCTHSTLRWAYQGIDETKFNDCMLAIDEFHHVSADNTNNRLGELLHSIMNKSNAHIVAMTGSYFRGDGVPVLSPEDEVKFDRVTYNYYEQLNGYTYLKSLGIGHHFYQGQYLSAVNEVLNTDKKTILHIPNVNSGESTKLKYEEVDKIIDIIGSLDKQDPDTGIQYIKRHGDGKIIKVADLVNDDAIERPKVQEYLRKIKHVDDVDLIIALGMAKEGFDWPYCEHALTVGYRSSLTELVQIIGRCTRDSSNKSHAQFTNLVAQPDADTQEVTVAVNNMLKAITCSLLMEQVLAPNFNFKTRLPNDNEPSEAGTIKIRGLKNPSEKVKRILEADLNDLKARILQDNDVLKALPNKDIDPEVINKTLIPKIIRETYPDLKDGEIEELRQYVVADSAFKVSRIKEEGGKRFIEFANRFINIDDLSIDLIDSINPFQRAYEILSKSLDKKTFKAIQEAINTSRISMTFERAEALYPDVIKFRQETGRIPDITSPDPIEREYASVILYLKDLRKRTGV